jgi:hypothetical protein
MSFAVLPYFTCPLNWYPNHICTPTYFHTKISPCLVLRHLKDHLSHRIPESHIHCTGVTRTPGMLYRYCVQVRQFSHYSAYSQTTRAGPKAWHRQEILLPSKTSGLALKPTQPPIQWVPGALSPGAERLGHEPNHSNPSTADIKHAGHKPPLLLHSIIHHNINSHIYIGTNPEQQDGYSWHGPWASVCIWTTKHITIHTNTHNLFQSTNILPRNLFNTCILALYLHISNIISHIYYFLW